MTLSLTHSLREGCTKLNPEKVWSFATPGGVSEGSKMPNLYFGVLKRVKNGLKMAKNTLKFYIFHKNAKPGGEGGSEGGLAKDHTFSGFCFVHPSLSC